MSKHEFGENHDESTDRARHSRPSAIADLTAAWHRTTDALRDSERRYRELVEYSLGLICTHDLTGTILSINPAAAQSLGYQPEEGIGRNLRDFLAPDVRHLFDEYLARLTASGHDAGLMRVVTRSGDRRVWMYRNVLSRDEGGTYVLGHAIDITERVHAERTLRESEQALRLAHQKLEDRVRERTAALEYANDRLQQEIAERERAEQSRERALVEQRDTLAFLAALSDRLAPILRFDELLNVIARLTVPFPADWTMVHLVSDEGMAQAVASEHVDPGCQRVLAGLVRSASGPLSPGSMLAEVVAAGQLAIATSAATDLTDYLLGPSCRAAVEDLRTGSAAMLPFAIDGRVKAVLSMISHNPAKFTGAGALIVEDVARRIGLALDRIHLYREAQDANRLKDEFLSTLSHELRTPLNAIFGWARILRTRDLEPGTAHAITVIERNAEAQLRLIEDVLDVSRIITGKMTLTLEPLNVRAVVRGTIDTLRPALQAKQIVLAEALGEDLPPVAADSHRLQQVFWNLLSNAVKFTGPGGTIALSLRAADGAIEFEITDTGIGIHRDVLPFVFDRFRQADSSLARTHGGLGLGLAIARHIVELHGGVVKASSGGEGLGATFTVRLPMGSDYRVEAEPQRPAATSTGPGHVMPLLCHRTILVVEDHDDARELIVNVLENAGARVLSVSATPEAIEAVMRDRPDAVVADIGLPGEDGYALLGRLRSRHRGLPAIALTAYARATDRDRALAAGFDRYLVKPVDPKELVAIVASIIPS